MESIIRCTPGRPDGDHLAPCPTVAPVGTSARLVIACVCALSLACGGGDGDDATAGEAGDDPSRSGEASPFVVDTVPAGFVLESAGRGTRLQDWGEDSTGTDEPFTVLAPPGVDAASSEAVIVSVTGYLGYQGGLSQAAGGYGGEAMEHFEVDGAAAIYTPAGAEAFGGATVWDELVVARGDDLAVRVLASDAGRDQLVDIARRVEPADDHARAPGVPDPPDGLDVIGSVDAGVEISLSAYVQPDSDSVPGLDSAYGAGWLSGPATAAPDTGPGPQVVEVPPGSATAAPGTGPSAGPPVTEVVPGPATVEAGPGTAAAAPTPSGGATAAPDEAQGATATQMAPPTEPTPLTLVAYPGEAADLDALPALANLHPPSRTVTPLTVGGRPGMLVESGHPGDEYSPPSVSRTVLTHAPWGDLLMAGSNGSPDAVPSADQLAEMLASVRQASGEEWEAFEIEAAGGPGLHPDDGAVELERGTVTGTDGEVDWLLQARPGALDACLKLSTRQRACAIGGSSSDGTSLGTGGGSPDRDSGVPEFVLTTIDVPGAGLRVTTPDGTFEGTLHPVPDSDLWGGVVFADGLGTAAPVCADTPEPPEHMTPVTIEILDDTGAVAGCVDLAGTVRPR